MLITNAGADQLDGGEGNDKLIGYREEQTASTVCSCRRAAKVAAADAACVVNRSAGRLRKEISDMRSTEEALWEPIYNK